MYHNQYKANDLRMMPAGFGFSVGDFLVVPRLVGNVVDALRESSDASSTFRGLINELYALESALLRVKRLDSDVSHVETVELQQAASRCQETIGAFYKKIQKYQPHLQQGGTGSELGGAWAKIMWTTCKKDDIDNFRAEIRGHTNSIEIVLLTIHMEATTTHTQQQDVQQNSLARRIQDFLYQVMGRLGTVTDSVTQSFQQGKALLESSAQIVQTNLRVVQVVREI